MTIYIAAYPRSGSTWFTRLLGDVLNSTTAGNIGDEKDIVNKARPGPYLIRRGHYILTDNDAGPVVPSSHHFAWKRLTNERIIFLVRDPRDICVSGAYYWQVEIEEFLEQMLRGDVAGLGRWDKYCERWLCCTHWPAGQFALTRYTDLLQDGPSELELILKRLNLQGQGIAEMVGHHSVAAYKAQWSEDELKQQNVRKGIAGDWRNYFTPAMNRRILTEFGWMMKRLEYE